MVRPELLDYLRQHRGKYPDEALKKGLVSQGVPEAEVDEAFEILAPRPPLPVSPPAPALPLKAPLEFAQRLTRGQKIAGGAALLLALAAYSALRPGMRMREIQRRVEEETADYRPQPFAALSSAAPYLPEQAPGNAGENYVEAVVLLGSLGGPAYLKGEKEAALMAALEKGAGKKSCAITGVLGAPQNVDAVLLWTSYLSDTILQGSMRFQERARALAGKRQFARAEAECKKQAAFDFHMLQDWDPTAQILGAQMLIGAALCVEQNRDKQGMDPYQERLRTVKLSRELEAFLPRTKDFEEIVRQAGRRDGVPVLSRYVDDPLLRRPYCAWALLQAAVRWSDEEAIGGAAWPERENLLKAAAASPDPRAAKLGRAAYKIFSSIRDGQSRAPQGDRLKLQKRIDDSMGLLDRHLFQEGGAGPQGS